MSLSIVGMLLIHASVLATMYFLGYNAGKNSRP